MVSLQKTHEQTGINDEAPASGEVSNLRFARYLAADSFQCAQLRLERLADFASLSVAEKCAARLELLQSRGKVCWRSAAAKSVQVCFCFEFQNCCIRVFRAVFVDCFFQNWLNWFKLLSQNCLKSGILFQIVGGNCCIE